MNQALVWEYWNGAWHRYGNGPIEAGTAQVIASLIRDPVSDDDDAYDVKIFEFEMAGTVAAMDSASFAVLHPKTKVTIRGRLVYVTRRLSAEAVEVYDDAEVAYRIVIAPRS